METWSFPTECPEMAVWQRILFIISVSTASVCILAAFVSSLLSFVFFRKRLLQIGKPFLSDHDESRTCSYSEKLDFADETVNSKIRHEPRPAGKPPPRSSECGVCLELGQFDLLVRCKSVGMPIATAPPAVFMYLFGIFNSWSQLTMMLVDFSIGSNLVNLDIVFSRPVPQPSDSFEAFKAAYNLVHLNVCASIPESLVMDEIRYDWTMKLEGSTLYDEQLPSTLNCSISWKAPVQASYIVTVTGYASNGTDKALMGQKRITVVDKWIAAVGDSYASGEGNPNTNCSEGSPATWISEQCHRSNRSWPFMVFSEFRHRFPSAAIHFTYVPCTGASVDNGILAGNRQSQLEVVGNISAFIGSGPDILLMSLGGNDVGYSEVLSHLINSGGDGDRSNFLFGGLDLRFFYVSHQIDRVAEKLRKIKPKMVVVPHYFDITENEYGRIDTSCEDLRKIPTQNLRQARTQILNRLNQMLSSKGSQNDWIVLSSGVRSIFAKKGICSKNPLIRSLASSTEIQCNAFGGFHPSEEAHSQIADAIWNAVERKLL